MSQADWGEARIDRARGIKTRDRPRIPILLDNEDSPISERENRSDAGMWNEPAFPEGRIFTAIDVQAYHSILSVPGSVFSVGHNKGFAVRLNASQFECRSKFGCAGQEQWFCGECLVQSSVCIQPNQASGGDRHAVHRSKARLQHEFPVAQNKNLIYITCVARREVWLKIQIQSRTLLKRRDCTPRKSRESGCQYCHGCFHLMIEPMVFRYFLLPSKEQLPGGCGISRFSLKLELEKPSCLGKAGLEIT